MLTVVNCYVLLLKDEVLYKYTKKASVMTLLLALTPLVVTAIIIEVLGN